MSKLNSSQYLKFITGGKAIFTFKSTTSGNRFTYRVSIPKDKTQETATLWFVSVLTGSDNNTCYSYIGYIKNNNIPGRVGTNFEFYYGHKSKIGREAQSVVAFDFVFNKIVATGSESRTLEIWHEGKCCRCGRKLTVPESIESGIGPECAGIKAKNKQSSIHI